MKEIIKKNIVLISVMVITFVISITLFLMVILTDAKRRTSDENINKVKKEIQDLSNKKPAPTFENLTNIKKDIELIRKKTYEFQKIFGNPYRKAFEVYLNVLGIDEQSFKNEWKSFQAKQDKKQTVVQVFDEFIKTKADEAKKGKAEDDFIKILNDDMFVKIKKSLNTGNDEQQSVNVNEYLLEYMGYPRKTTPEECIAYVSNFQKELLTELEVNRVNIAGVGKKLNLFTEFEKVPPQELTPYIIKHCRLYDDFFKRIINSKITSLDSFQKKNGIEGEKIDNYLVFKYEFQITSTLQALRSLLNSLQTAALTDNRVYIVKSIMTNKLVDEIIDIKYPVSSTTQPALIAPAALSAKQKDELVSTKKENLFDDTNISSFVKNLKDKGFKFEDKSENDMMTLAKQIVSYGYEINTENGNIVITKNDIILSNTGDACMVKSILEFDYVIYIGDETKVK